MGHHPAPPLVIGIGNPMRRDDGAGPAVVARLAGTPGLELTVLDGEATRLLQALRGRSRVIVVDAAVRGDEAGTIHRLDGVQDPPATPGRPASSHGAGLADALDLARALDALPAQLVVFGIEPADLSHGEGLSVAVDRAAHEVVDRIRAELVAR